MDKSLLFKAGPRIAEYYVFKKSSPLIVSYLTTYKCNQTCKYCDWSLHKNREADTNQAISLIEQMKKSGTIKLGFAGGESLVRKDIDLLLECSHKSGIITSISTNGRSVPSHIDSIERYVDVLQVSIDGPEEIHDELRGKGSYKAAVEAINAGKYAGVKVVTNTVITKSTVMHLPFIVNLAKDLGFEILFQPAFNYILSAQEEIIEQIKPSREQLLDAVKYLISEKKKGSPVGNSLPFLHYIEKNWPVGGLKRCHANGLFCTIGPYGEIMPCCFAASAYNWPNAIELGFEEAYKRSCKNDFVKKCTGCYCNAYIEATLLFSLNLSTCLNALNIFS